MGRRFALLITALALVAAACSDDAAEGRAYFEELQTLTTGYGTTVAALPAASTQGSLGDAMRFFEGVNRALRDMTTQLAELTPPEQLTGAHTGFVDSMTEFSDLAGKVVLQGRRMQEPQDLLRLANDPVVGVANFRTHRDVATAACHELQTLADDRAFEIDLSCSSLESA